MAKVSITHFLAAVLIAGALGAAGPVMAQDAGDADSSTSDAGVSDGGTADPGDAGDAGDGSDDGSGDVSGDPAADDGSDDGWSDGGSDDGTDDGAGDGTDGSDDPGIDDGWDDSWGDGSGDGATDDGTGDDGSVDDGTTDDGTIDDGWTPPDVVIDDGLWIGGPGSCMDGGCVPVIGGWVDEDGNVYMPEVVYMTGPVVGEPVYYTTQTGPVTDGTVTTTDVTIDAGPRLGTNFGTVARHDGPGQAAAAEDCGAGSRRGCSN